MDIVANTPVEYKYLETMAKTFISPARHNQFFQENIFDKAPIRKIAKAMNTNSASTGPYTKNPFWYQHINLEQSTILIKRLPTVDVNVAHSCRP